MSGGGEAWIAGFDPASGTLALPLWSAAVVAALCVFVLSRAGRDGVLTGLPRIALLALVGGTVTWVVLDAAALAAQRRALDVRMAEMTAHAVAPGSPLACLDGAAGELVEAACEKALFASPEAAAASVAYVTAQLSLLADASDYERRSGASYGQALTALRHAVETDRFGIAAHVLANRDGCTANRCQTFALLHDASQVSDNISGHKYESYILHHAPEWPQSPLSPVAAAAPVPSPPAGAAAAPPGKPNGLFFPSSASIPAVSIMSAEPVGTPAPAVDAAKPPTVAGKPAANAVRRAAPQTQPAQRLPGPTNLVPPAGAAGTSEPSGNP